MPQNLRKPAVYEARCARQAMSLPEVLLWRHLKGSPEGIRFRKQHPIGPYRADFYCTAARLVIEIDGMAHDTGSRPQRDDERTRFLQAAGYAVVRISAADVWRDPDAAARSIVASAAHPLRQPLRGCHLPVNGEDRESA